MSKTTFTRIKQKHDLEVNWLTSDLIPYQGEIIVYDSEIDSEGNILNHPSNRQPYNYARFKIGDGHTNVNNLEFASLIAEDVAIIDPDNSTVEDVEVVGGGSANIDVTATVGQTIVVKEVDANGKPTKWESADYQPRTHWDEIVPVFPLSSFEYVPDEETGGQMISEDILIKEGETYIVSYNNTEYTCTAAAFPLGADDGITGSAYVIGDVNSTGEFPFVILSLDVVIGDITMKGTKLLTYEDPQTIISLSIQKIVYHKIPYGYLPPSPVGVVLNVEKGGGITGLMTISEPADGWDSLPKQSELDAALMRGAPIVIRLCYGSWYAECPLALSIPGGLTFSIPSAFARMVNESAAAAINVVISNNNYSITWD